MAKDKKSRTIAGAFVPDDLTSDDIGQCVRHTDRPARNPDTDEFEEGTTRSANGYIDIEDVPDPASLGDIYTEDEDECEASPTRDKPCRCLICRDSNNREPDGVLILKNDLSEDVIIRLLFGGCNARPHSEDGGGFSSALGETVDHLKRTLAGLNTVSQARFIEGVVFYTTSQARVFGLQRITPVCRETLKKENRIAAVISRVSRSLGGEEVSIEFSPSGVDWKLICSLDDYWNHLVADFGVTLSSDKDSVLARFETEILSRLEGLPIPEKKSFVKGIVFTIKAIANESLKLTPVSRERFSSCLLAEAYSIAHGCKFKERFLETMRGDIKNLGTVTGRAANVMFAKKLQHSMGIRLGHEESCFFQLNMATFRLMRKQPPK